jgi:hypothetical protein
MKFLPASILTLVILGLASGCASDQEPMTPRQQRALEIAAQRAEEDKAREATALRQNPHREQIPNQAPLPSPQATQTALPVSVASLLKAGGRQLQTEELRELLKGVAWEGPLPGGWYRTRLRPDGRYQNILLSQGEKNLDSHGYWYVDPQGRVCSQPADEAAEPRCSSWFQLKNQYYVGASSDPSAQLVVRKLIR